MDKTKLKPGTPEHEKAVKAIITDHVDNTLAQLEKLNVVEAKQLEIGKSFLAFRFNVNERSAE